MNVDNRSAGGPVDLFFAAGHVGVESVADYPGADSAVAKGDLKGMGVRTVTLRLWERPGLAGAILLDAGDVRQ